MRFAWLALLAGCGGGSGHPSMDVSTQFQVTQFSGNGPSPLDPLQGQTIDVSIHWDQTDFNNGDGSDPTGCKTLAIGYGFGVTTRTAHGATAQLVQTEILDRLDNWDIVLQLCDAAGASSVTAESTIDALNLSFGCFGVPASAMRKNAAGYPELTSFTASQCTSTILDVSNNRVLGNDNFTMTIATNPSQLP
jgi:hypothetical protein